MFMPLDLPNRMLHSGSPRIREEIELAEALTLF